MNAMSLINRRHAGRRRVWSMTFVALLATQLLAACDKDPAGAVPPQATPVAGENCPQTAARTQGWRNVAFRDDFTNAGSSQNNWWIYDGPGNGGHGRRTPAALSVAGGMLTFTADSLGNSGGIAQKTAYVGKYGAWETCIRSSMSAPAYHSVALLWPNDNAWPVGGEVDFMEIRDPMRTNLEYNLHFGAVNHVESHSRTINGLQWHSYAVQWTPTRISVFVDGVMWAQSTEVSRFPRGPMHLCLQLDNFGGMTVPGAQMQVDWAAQYRP